ncbi:MAG: histidine kinase dimerization/phospho-acceptor domain-containing protein [Pseudomonadota bacterium]
MRSLTTRTLLLLLFGGLVASFLSAFLIFVVSETKGQDKAIRGLEGYADLISKREEERFEQIGAALSDARQNLERAAPEFVREAPLTQADAALFDRLFPAAGDGTRRSSDAVFDGMMLPSGQYLAGFAAFIPGGNALSNQRKRVLLAAFRAIRANTSRIRQGLGNMVFVSGEGDIIAYGPGYQQALMVYRRYAKSDFDIFQSGYIRRPDAAPDGLGKLTCSELLRFSSRGAASNLAISCQTSVALQNGIVGAFGATVVTKDVFGQVYDHAVRAIDVFLVSGDGTFITAPQTALQQKLNVVGEPVDAFLDPSTSWLLPNRDKTAPVNSAATARDAEQPYFTASRRLDTPGWTLAFTYPVSAPRLEALGQAGRLLGSGILVTLFACLLTSVALRLGVSAPLNSLAAQADTLASSLRRYDGKAPRFDLPTQRKDEVGALSRSFEVLARSAMAEKKIQQDRYEKRTHQLENQTLSAHEAHAASQALLTRLSQDIRTPTNAIVGFANMLKTELPGDISVEMRQHFDLLADNAEHLARLVDSLLESEEEPHAAATKMKGDEAA